MAASSPACGTYVEEDGHALGQPQGRAQLLRVVGGRRCLPGILHGPGPAGSRAGLGGPLGLAKGEAELLPPSASGCEWVCAAWRARSSVSPPSPRPPRSRTARSHALLTAPGPSHPRTMQRAAPLMRTCAPQNTCRGEGAFRQRPAQQQPSKEGPRPLGLLPKGGHPKSLVAGGGFVCLALAQSRSPCPSLPEGE